jgi:osmoprotectant transport system permease protein
MGFGRAQRLLRIELPLALPVIVAGLRIAIVTQIGIATIAAYINAGGLGALIFAGINQRFPEKIIVGAAVASLLAIAADRGLAYFERRLRAAQAA